MTNRVGRVAAVVTLLTLLGATVAFAALGPINGSATVGVTADRVAQPPSQPGNPGGVPLPADAVPVDTSNPDRVIGTGTPASCTSAAVVAAVAAGGVITFDCGPTPVTITMTATAKVVNTSPVVVLDGGGKVTLDGAGVRRILYMNTCDPAQVWTTSHCQNQASPQLTVQGLHFTNGNSTGETAEGGGGGAVFVRGGRFAVFNSEFTRNRCDPTGPDVGGAALRVLSQYQARPVIVAGSTFGGPAPDDGNECSNGAALSSIDVSWRVYNSVFTHNRAIGTGSNPTRPGTPGGGSGGAIYLDGAVYTFELAGSIVTDNIANEGGGAIFLFSNNAATLTIRSSTLLRNPSLRFETAGYPGIFFIGAGQPQLIDTTIG